MYSPEVKCRSALICCTQTSTLQPIFSSDDYVFSLVNFVQSCSCTCALDRRATLPFIIRPVTFTAVFMSHQTGTEASEDNRFHMSVRPCMFTLAQPHSQHRECFESPRFPFHSRHSRLVEHFGSFWSTFQPWIPRPWCTFKTIQEGAETPWRHDDGEPCWIFLSWKREICLKKQWTNVKRCFSEPTLYGLRPMNQIQTHQSRVYRRSILKILKVISIMRWITFKVIRLGQIQLLQPKNDQETW